MQFKSELHNISFRKRINYNSKVFSIGSCFAEHIAIKLRAFKFNLLSNTYGIVYNPVSIALQLQAILKNHTFESKDVFFHEGIYRSYFAHSKIGAYTEKDFLNKINDETRIGNAFLLSATHLVITLGTAYVHRLNSTGFIVANNHKQPDQKFTKQLLTVSEVVNSLEEVIQLLLHQNPALQIVFTISPVRHLREGLVENTRSKSVLFVALQQLSENYALQYFPAYEYIIDDLRDYRFYEPDMVHPNRQAISYVWDKFREAAIDATCYTLMDEIQSISNAMLHKPFFPETKNHQEFRNQMLEKVLLLQKINPDIDLNEEIRFFS